MIILPTITPIKMTFDFIDEDEHELTEAFRTFGAQMADWLTLQDVHAVEDCGLDLAAAIAKHVKAYNPDRAQNVIARAFTDGYFDACRVRGACESCGAQHLVELHNTVHCLNCNVTHCNPTITIP